MGVGIKRDELLTKAEAAEYLNTSVRHVTRLLQERRLPYVKLGGLVRIRRSALDEYIDSRTVSKWSA